jgi:hypothetical protein
VLIGECNRCSGCTGQVSICHSVVISTYSLLAKHTTIQGDTLWLGQQRNIGFVLVIAKVVAQHRAKEQLLVTDEQLDDTAVGHD